MLLGTAGLQRFQFFEATVKCALEPGMVASEAVQFFLKIIVVEMG